MTGIGNAGAAAILALGLAGAGFAQSEARGGGRPWWERSVFYEIYPRSFQDTDGDGVGDLNGIRERLPYLAKLGVDAIWITPFYPSPQVDFGYDISDYENVDPRFGTLADFDKLAAEAHRLRIKIVTDLVLNHTSDRAQWFVESRSGKNSPYRDWYIWRDGKNGGPPNNWSSEFGPTAWTLDPKTGQYYYHFFYVEQPDLNWRNPAVQKRIFDMVRFWLKRGVDGFRLDAINQMFEDPALTDNPVLPKMRRGSKTEREQINKYNRDLPETHEILRKLRAVVEEFGGDKALIGEVWVPSMTDLAEYYGPHNDELQLPFNFFFTKVPALRAGLFREQVAKAETALAGHWTTWVLSNHDLTRALSRYGDGAHDAAIAKLLGAMLLTLRGSPFLYYGEEIGMVNHDPKTREEVRDPVGKTYWPAEKGRDGERTPMQWTAGRNAGFTTGAPWLPVPASAAETNVAAEMESRGSVLDFYTRMIEIRRRHPALVEGAYEPLGTDPDVFVYRRSLKQGAVVVALNMSNQERNAGLGALAARPMRVLIDNLREEGPALGGRDVRLLPYEAAVLEIVN